MNDTQKVSLSLSNEEMAFLLAALNLKTLPGMEEEPSKYLSDLQLAQIHTAGYNALRARGWVTHKKERPEALFIEPGLAAMIITCAVAQRIIVVTSKLSSGAVQVSYIHFAEHLVVVHQKYRAGIHELIGLVEQKDVLPLVKDLLNIDSQLQSDASSFVIPVEHLELIAEEVQKGDIEGCLTQMRNYNVHEATARLFLKTLQSMRTNATILSINLGSEQEGSVAGFSMVEDAETIWLLQATDTSPSELVVRQVSGELFTQYLCKMLPSS